MDNMHVIITISKFLIGFHQLCLSVCQTFDYGHGNGSVQESYDYDHGSGGEPYQVSQSQYYSQDVQQYQVSPSVTCMAIVSAAKFIM